MKNIAIIPARSGSKGLKNKNIKLLNNMPLLAHSIDAAKKTNLFDTIMVSTDSERYAQIALEYGAEVPFLRSAHASSDVSGSWEVVKEVLKGYKELGKEFDTVTILQPTSPLRTSKDIEAGFSLLEEKHGDSIIAVCEMEHSPLWSNTLPKNLSINNFINHDIVNQNRQQIPTYYRINGALYIRKIFYGNTVVIADEDTYALIMEQSHSVDIDSELDFRIAEMIMCSS